MADRGSAECLVRSSVISSVSISKINGSNECSINLAKYLHDFWIVQLACAALNDAQRFFFRRLLSVWAVVCQGIPTIDDCKDACREWNIFSFQSVWVAFPIPMLVMITRDVGSGFQEANLFQHIVSIERMLFHDHPFVVTQFARFMQDTIRNTHLANIVQHGAPANMTSSSSVKSNPCATATVMFSNASGMTFCFFIP